MTTEITTTTPSALNLMAQRCSVDPGKLHETLKNTVFKGATDHELLALVVTANTYELNPLLKEMYAFPKKGGGIAPMVGVDGWLKIANRQPNFDGMQVEVFGDGKEPTHATCEIHLKDRKHSVKITEYFDECVRPTEPWRQMPRRMLRNKAMIQSIRVAFGVGGIHDEDEAHDIASGKIRNVTPRKQSAESQPIDPFKVEDGADEIDLTPSPAPEPAAETPPVGKQKKPRLTREGTFQNIAAKEGNGKKFWVVSVEIGDKTPEFVTFSTTLSEQLYDLEIGTPIKVIVTKNADGKTYALEDYEVINGKDTE